MERLPGVLSEMSGCDVVRIDSRSMTGEELRNSVIEKLLAARYTRHNARSTDSGQLSNGENQSLEISLT